ncbi:unnamed protein product [Rotaria sp. Silwood2]|nr:unnamed protein product [Rotaria sp. Silwood2]CAF3980362.1 unnamed protein product [Rotaria sp. Silwood2]CAF4108389.1 unnamed protein product [Rotaria sp. Silwood2]
MLTFKQSVILLVSIITVLAIIAIITGLSPLYWPRPKTLSNENNTSVVVMGKKTNSSNLKTQLATRLKVVTKKILELTTVKINSTSSMMPNLVVANTTIIE